MDSTNFSTVPQPGESVEELSSELVPPPLAHLWVSNSWRESQEQENSTLSPQCERIIYHDPDDAIARHQFHTYCSHSYHHHNYNHDPSTLYEHDNNQLAVPYACTDPGLARSLSMSSSSIISHAHSVPTFPARLDSFCSINPRNEFLESLDHGTSAIEEEEAALEHAAALIALKAMRSRSSRSSRGALSLFRGAGTSVNDEPNTIQDPGAAHDTEEHDEIEEEKDHCLSGICLPRSQFFQTSVICSNTMARDGLANERTFLSWLNFCSSLCLVSCTFMSRSFSLEVLQATPQNNQRYPDKLSRAVGYVCFISAFLASLYSLLKYLRNIRRISTRYPFAQAGKWTFTVGMSLGSLVMIVLVLAYTEHL